ncbi:hypothetical protein V1511DRAFT_502052 [Dipodascopsis uninucleata]
MKFKIGFLVIILSNAYCFFIHMFSSLPVSREANSGYLHGGLTIEFIGQRAPASRFQFFISDIIIVILQIAILLISFIMFESENMQSSTTSSNSNSSDQASSNVQSSEADRTVSTQSDVDVSVVDADSSLISQEESSTVSQSLGSSVPDSGASTLPVAASSRASDSTSRIGDVDGFSGEVVAIEIHLTDLIGAARHRTTTSNNLSSMV